MEITTSKGKTFNANWATKTAEPDELFIEIMDDRSVLQIANDFDGVDRIERKNEEGIKSYDGYTMLISVVRNLSRETVQITMKKP